MRKGSPWTSNSPNLQNKRIKTDNPITRVSSAEWLSQYDDNPEELSNIPYASVFDYDMSPILSYRTRGASQNGKINTTIKIQGDITDNANDSVVVRDANENTKRMREKRVAASNTSKKQVRKSTDKDSVIIRDNKSSVRKKKYETRTSKPLDNCATNSKRSQSKIKSIKKSDLGEYQESSYTNKDVLCCRGGKANNHEGNIQYLKIVRKRKEKYCDLSKNEKSIFALSIVHEIQSKGGRFIRFQDGIWTEVDDETARKKVSAALRE